MAARKAAEPPPCPTQRVTRGGGAEEGAKVGGGAAQPTPMGQQGTGTAPKEIEEALQKAEKALLAMRKLEADPRIMAEPIANQEVLVAELRKKLQAAKPLPAWLASAHAKVACHKGTLEEVDKGIADLEAKLRAARTQRLEAQEFLRKAEQELEELRNSWVGGSESKETAKGSEDLKEVLHLLKQMKDELIADLPDEKKAGWTTRLHGLRTRCPKVTPEQETKRQRTGGGITINLEENQEVKPMGSDRGRRYGCYRGQEHCTGGLSPALYVAVISGAFLVLWVILRLGEGRVHPQCEGMAMELDAGGAFGPQLPWLPERGPWFSLPFGAPRLPLPVGGTGLGLLPSLREELALLPAFLGGDPSKKFAGAWLFVSVVAPWSCMCCFVVWLFGFGVVAALVKCADRHASQDVEQPQGQAGAGWGSSRSHPWGSGLSRRGYVRSARRGRCPILAGVLIFQFLGQAVQGRPIHKVGEYLQGVGPRANDATLAGSLQGSPFARDFAAMDTHGSKVDGTEGEWPVDTAACSRCTTVSVLLCNVTQLNAHTADVKRMQADCNMLQEVRATAQEADQLSRQMGFRLLLAEPAPGEDRALLAVGVRKGSLQAIELQVPAALQGRVQVAGRGPPPVALGERVWTRYAKPGPT